MPVLRHSESSLADPSFCSTLLLLVITPELLLEIDFSIFYNTSPSLCVED